MRGGTADLAVVFRHVLDTAPVEGDLRPRAAHPPPGARGRAGRRDRRATSPTWPGERWIAGCARCRTHLLRCAAGRGFVPDVRFATDDHVVVQRLVARGLGVALLPSWALEASAQPGVRALPVAGVDDRVVDVLVRPDARRVPGVAAVLTGLRAACAELVTPQPR